MHVNDNVFSTKSLQNGCPSPPGLPQEGDSALAPQGGQTQWPQLCSSWSVLPGVPWSRGGTSHVPPGSGSGPGVHRMVPRSRPFYQDAGLRTRCLSSIFISVSHGAQLEKGF